MDKNYFKKNLFYYIYRMDYKKKYLKYKLKYLKTKNIIGGINSGVSNDDVPININGI
tara:strand:- start:81 stop:251 length:171 start_codon:yes stop_codon:yes gene_type:complete